MSRTNRTLTLLALSLALATATATTAVAAAAQPTPPAVEDQHDRLLRNLEAGQAERTQAAVEQARAIERNGTTAAAQPAARVEDQNDRLLRNLEAGQAVRTQAAVEQARAGERNLGPVPVVTIAPQPVPAAAGRNVDLLATLLLGLVGGLVGGAAVWTAANRRHAHRAVAA
jgi:hypothetical protein